MPTPLAHGVAGYAVAATIRSSRTERWRLTALAIAISWLPDLDFIPGIFVGDAGRYHRGPTHSLAGALLFSLPLALVITLVFRARSRDQPRMAGDERSFGFWYLFTLAVWFSHIVLDLLSPDMIGNSGMRLWWPVSNVYVATTLPLPAWLIHFVDLQFGPTATVFFHTLFSFHALGVAIVEALLFSPVLLMPITVAGLRRWRAARHLAHGAARPAQAHDAPPAGELEGTSGA